MDAPGPHCSNCQRSLPQADAICAFCEPELAKADPDPAMGRFKCPACMARFAKPRLIMREPLKPWYKFQQPALACPHCRAFLRDRRPPVGSYGTDIVALLVIVIYLMPSLRELARVLLLVVAAVFISWDFYVRRKFKDEIRYAPLDDTI